MFVQLKMCTVAACALLICLCGVSSFGQEPVPQQSTTGPVPPASVEPVRTQAFEGGGASPTIPGVPSYMWRHGCGPTALGMVLGYYDSHGYPALYAGDASNQTESVNQEIASQGSGIKGSGLQLHFEDYALPNDSDQSPILPDCSVGYPDGCHASNSIADFMHTSWSADGNRYGWSWSSKIIDSFRSYVNLKSPYYRPQSTMYYGSSLTWSVLTNEIDNNRPMVFLVDSTGDGVSDHFVTVVGYSDGATQQYGCLDTWYSSIRWVEFKGMSTSYPWGIWGGWSFDLSARTCPTDFEGQSKSNLAVYRPGTGTWYVLSTAAAGSFSSTQWGISGDIGVQSDYDGDRKSDIAVWRPGSGTWYIRPSGTAGIFTATPWGTNGDVPVPGDYDGDGKADRAVWRPGSGVWYIRPSGSPDSYTSAKWGMHGDIPVPGDYDGDGRTDLAVFRPGSGIWYIRKSSAQGSYTSVQWGAGSDVPVPGDYDVDAKTDIAVWRPGSGVWYVRPSSTSGFTATQWGTGGDAPVTGDYDGDGRADIAVWRPGSGVWYIRPSGSPGSFVAKRWGISGDVPVSPITPILTPIP